MSGLYSPPLAQQKFLLDRVFDIVGILGKAEGHLDRGTCWTILDSAAQFCSEVLSPLNPIGDRRGCVLEGHNVTMPPGFKRAYMDFVELGWSALSAPSKFGGQQAPMLLQVAVSEMVIGACMSFSMLSLQQRAAVRLLARHADHGQYGALISDIAGGRCGATIAMTEANAGSDVGNGTTRAVLRSDGRFDLHGTKVFISYADHDLTGQIVHLVLAREFDERHGGSGMSLFLVPKWLDEARTVRNSVFVTAIEHKMGLKASPTCVLSFEGAIGERIGDPGKGLATIFSMVNAMRLEVAMHGVAIGHAAYARARLYAEERRQGRNSANRGPVALIEHPDVRRNLLMMRARVEGLRALIFETASRLDLAERSSTSASKEAQRLADFLLPVCKAAGSEGGFEAANIAMQIHGGYGYVEATGIEQLVRDVRVSSIFEGANGIQAIDLVTRKLTGNQGSGWSLFTQAIREDLSQMATGIYVSQVTDALENLEEAAEVLVERLGRQPELALGGATPFLHAVANVALGWMWLRQQAAGVAEVLHDPKLGDVVGFFFQNIFPATGLHLHQATHGAAAVSHPFDG